MARSTQALFFVAIFAASVGVASAQSSDMTAPMSASTMPPKAPKYPAPPKPDFSSMQFLLGTWKCSQHSERRGNELTYTTTTFSMMPDGYFMKGVSKSPKVSYAATGSTSTDYYTYDSRVGRWIDMTIASQGGYGYATSTGWKHGHMLWSFDSFLPDGDLTSSTGQLMTKVSDTKYRFASAFTTEAGLLNRVTGTCVKQ